MGGVRKIEAPGEGGLAGEGGAGFGGRAELGDHVPAIVEVAVAGFEGGAGCGAALPNGAGEAAALGIVFRLHLDVGVVNGLVSGGIGGFHLDEAVFCVPQVSPATVVRQVPIGVVGWHRGSAGIPEVLGGEIATPDEAVNNDVFPDGLGGVLARAEGDGEVEEFSGAGGRGAVDLDVRPGEECAANGGARCIRNYIPMND